MIRDNMYDNIIDIFGWYFAWKLIDRFVDKYELNKKYYVDLLLLVLFVAYLIIKHKILV